MVKRLKNEVDDDDNEDVNSLVVSKIQIVDFIFKIVLR